VEHGLASQRPSFKPHALGTTPRNAVGSDRHFTSVRHPPGDSRIVSRESHSLFTTSLAKTSAPPGGLRVRCGRHTGRPSLGDRRPHRLMVHVMIMQSGRVRVMDQVGPPRSSEVRAGATPIGVPVSQPMRTRHRDSGSLIPQSGGHSRASQGRRARCDRRRLGFTNDLTTSGQGDRIGEALPGSCLRQQ
jgi:hypothetical protein